jgi:hypothetical protein
MVLLRSRQVLLRSRRVPRACKYLCVNGRGYGLGRHQVLRRSAFPPARKLNFLSKKPESVI